MATSSITKEFVIKDAEAYLQMMNEISDKPDRTVKTIKSSNIERGKELLKQFLFH